MEQDNNKTTTMSSSLYLCILCIHFCDEIQTEAKLRGHFTSVCSASSTVQQKADDDSSFFLLSMSRKVYNNNYSYYYIVYSDIIRKPVLAQRKGKPIRVSQEAKGKFDCICQHLKNQKLESTQRLKLFVEK